MEVRGRKCREMSPNRSKICITPAFKKVQVVYYLTRNGHLEHPHYIEVTHLANQQIRLKDVLDRLTMVRGKGMPSLYSWSCKRIYKNGYVWNDLTENDAIYPSEGAEYVLKGSELIEGSNDKLQLVQVGVTQQQFQQLQIGNNQPAQIRNFQPKCKSFPSKRHPELEEVVNNQYVDEEEDDHEEEVEAEEEEEYEEKTSYTSSTPSQSRCSRGVSTDEIKELQEQHKDEDKLFTRSPTLSDKGKNVNDNIQRFEDGDPVANEPMLSRSSMLFNLIACGGSGSFRKTAPAPYTRQPVVENGNVVRKRSNGDGLYKEVVCRAAMGGNEEEMMMIGCMSENPRFGNLQAEEKEYFSGSIVESIGTEGRVEVRPVLKKSNSYNEERSIKAELEAAEEKPKSAEKSHKGKCIPRKKSSSKQPKKTTLSAN